LSLGAHDVLPMFEAGAPMAGGHAMCVLGYDARGVIVINSWGQYWGNAGLCHLSWDFFTSGWVDDKWTIRSMPQIG
jgi:C1A family cysteine protease